HQRRGRPGRGRQGARPERRRGPRRPLDRQRGSPQDPRASGRPHPHPRRGEVEAGMKIGFIGTGAMGQPMVANLIKQGHSVVAYDIVPAALAAAVARGATAVGSAAEAAKAGDLVITMLPSSSHVVRVYLAEGGVLEGVASGHLCVDMSTVEPGTSRLVAE